MAKRSSRMRFERNCRRSLTRHWVTSVRGVRHVRPAIVAHSRSSRCRRRMQRCWPHSMPGLAARGGLSKPGDDRDPRSVPPRPLDARRIGARLRRGRHRPARVRVPRPRWRKVGRAKVPRIAYVSCNPVTFRARCKAAHRRGRLPSHGHGFRWSTNSAGRRTCRTCRGLCRFPYARERDSEENPMTFERDALMQLAGPALGDQTGHRRDHV